MRSGRLRRRSLFLIHVALAVFGELVGSVAGAAADGAHVPRHVLVVDLNVLREGALPPVREDFPAVGAGGMGVEAGGLRRKCSPLLLLRVKGPRPGLLPLMPL